MLDELAALDEAAAVSMSARSLASMTCSGPARPSRGGCKGYEHRDGQLAMARAVHHALAKDGHLFVEAGTGTGKTLAYLVPAILSGRKVVVSTATHALQEQIFTKDLPLVREVLAEHGVEFKAALMKGLSNYLCKRRLARAAAQRRAGLGRPRAHRALGARRRSTATAPSSRSSKRARTRGATSQSSTETRIGAGCTFYDECFVTRMRREAEQAQVVVVNHHLFFADLALRTGKNGGFGGAIPNYDAVIFDEAHQIESVATDFFGVRISTARLDSLVRDARRGVIAAKILDATSMSLVDNVEHAGQHVLPRVAGRRQRVRSAVVARTPLARGGPRRARWRGEPAHARPHRLDRATHRGARPARCRARGASRVRARQRSRRRGHGPRASRRRSARRSRAHHVDEPHRGEALGRGRPRRRRARAGRRRASRAASSGSTSASATCRSARARSISGRSSARSSSIASPSVVCTSATLATATSVGPSFHFARSRLGARADTVELVVPSPFDFATRAALYVAEDLPEPTEQGFEEACAESRRRARRDHRRRRVRALHVEPRDARIRDALHGRVPGPLLVQGEAPKHVLLDRFRDSGAAVLVATMSFWEGVDVPGNALRLVVLDKIPFAVPSDPVVAARCARIEAEGGNPFTQYSVPSAAITLKQGFGRLIRTKKDAGLVALLDRRAVRKGYGKSLLASLPPARRVRTLDDVREFWHDIDADS